MNLRGFVALANLSENVGVDLWHYATPDGRSIRAALDFLVPYVADPSKKWPYEQIKPIDYKGLAPILRQAATVYREPRYEKLAAGLPEVEPSAESSK
jgi:hypothetical protein